MKEKEEKDEMARNKKRIAAEKIVVQSEVSEKN